MVPRPARFALLSLSCLCLSGCATFEVEHPILLPAEKELPSDTDKLLVVDRHQLIVTEFKPDPITKVIFGKLFENQARRREQAARRWVDRSLKSALSLDFQDVFNDVGKYKVDVYDVTLQSPAPPDTEAPAGSDEQIPPLPSETVIQLAQEHEADLLCVLERVTISLPSDCSETKEKKKNKKGETYTESTWDCNADVHCALVFRLYDGRSGVWIEQDEQSHFQRVTGDDMRSSWSEGEILQKQEALFDVVFFECFRRYAQRLTPHYSNTTERIFVDTNSELRAELEHAAMLYQHPIDWKLAIPLWQSLLEREEPGPLKAKILCNLSLAAARQEDFATALELAEDAVLEDASGPIDRNLRRIRARFEAYTVALSQLP